MAHDVFISYSAKDKQIADAACAMLERNGVRVWIAPRDVPPGVRWGESFFRAIDDACVFVLVFSNAANDASHIEREVTRAIKKKLTVITFRVEDVLPSDALGFCVPRVGSTRSKSLCSRAWSTWSIECRARQPKLR